MSPATPASVSLGSPRALGSGFPGAASARASIWALFPAAIVAGTGLGLVLLAATAPPPSVPPLLPVDARPDTAQVSVAATPSEPAQGWAPLFGTAAPIDEAEPDLPPPPAPVSEPEPFDSFDDAGLVLRGIALADDDNDAFAIVEGEDGINVVRIGDVIDGQFEVAEILPDGVELMDLDDDNLYLLEFEILSDRASITPETDDPDPMDEDDFETVSDGSDVYDPDLDMMERRREGLGDNDRMSDEDLSELPSFGSNGPNMGISR